MAESTGTPTKKKKKKKRTSTRQTVMVNSRMQAFLDGKIRVEDLDDEEIRRGMIRGANGTFQGQMASQVIPRKFYEAVREENIKRWQKKVEEELEPALQVLKDIASSPRAPADARYKSAVYLIERAAGKIPEKTEAKVEVQPWAKNIDGILVGDDDDEED